MLRRLAVNVRPVGATRMAHLNAYGFFIRKAYKTPGMRKQLAGLAISERGRMTSRWFQALNQKEKDDLAKQGKKVITKRKPYKPKSAFHKFVRKAYRTRAIRALPQKKRKAAVLKAWWARRTPATKKANHRAKATKKQGAATKKQGAATKKK